MPKRKTIIWIVIGAVVLIGIVYFAFLRKPKVEYSTIEAKKRELSQTVSVSGTLKANEDVGLNFETPGRIKESRIKIGDKVAKGDVLAILDQTNLQFGVDQTKANLDKARADAGANSDTIHTDEVAVENAGNSLDDTKSLNNANVDSANQTAKDAKKKLDDAQSYYDQVKSESGASSSTTKSAKLTLDTAEAEYNIAKKNQDVADQQADLAKTEAENSLDLAKANLSAAKSNFVAASNNATVKSFEAAYETALNNFDKAVLHAPTNGVIKEVNFKAGEVIGSPSITSQNSFFGEMISYDNVFEAQVSETDIAKVSVGQDAVLTFDAFPNETFDAQVISIEPSATIVQNVVDFVVKIAISKNDLRLKDGMSADVDISTAKEEDVISIPERTAKDQNGQKIVQVLTGGKPEDRVVKLGLSGDNGMVEITSGLNEGDQVITSQ
ncbi:MAG: efflux RND transporter periplasmic adaptor subunit [Candidatus Moranbacteria bacterium]|nr:efflux RND transporter periplasmic adaptor subunit [Candidatus Moranbacteria bacterium]